jgi:benzoyl-CoA reductase/2-hydroxyglutaryl-CoA dehydratase subunit BcrC/BadD/HgdB
MIGFTTSIPVEFVFASKLNPVDLNNIFISNDNSDELIDIAEKAGFPRSTCSWIKGIYSAVKKNENIKKVINVVEGDCSNTKALMEVLEYEGVECIAFAYPKDKNYENLKKEMKKLSDFLKIDIEEGIKIKKELINVRKNLEYYDELTWKYNKVSGFDNHYWLVSSSDFFGDFKKFNELLKDEIKKAKSSEEKKESIRLGYIGVPPIFKDIYKSIEEMDARVVYNEIQRQFTMYDSNKEEDIVKSYLNYTYPYDLNGRLEDIKNQIKKRNLNGIIHYTQAFCFRGIEDILVRKELDIPVLTIEGDRPGKVDARTKLRIEAFIDMLRD